ncbi:hypothetical protein HNY73_006719 [Argiope bruennichi]|uniref:Uncharacterized protein n=1 Tax=Argiope bruennichi TaxID=94029 RepID=A0A8T0FHA1_ARGBR|nr:hypothetical protein HNY73_006719 [Argiope bruennichi]
MLLVVLCFAAVIYVAMADDKPHAMAGKALYFTKMLLVVLCFAAVIYVAMADDDSHVMAGKPLYFTKVTDSDGNVIGVEQHEG